MLGTLLGLGIYQSMERIASDNARVNGAKKRELEQEVTIHNVTIAEFGKPDEELEDLQIRTGRTGTQIAGEGQ